MASKRPSSVRRGRARCPIAAGSRRRPAAPPQRRDRRPSPQAGTPPPARGAADRTRAPTRSAARRAAASRPRAPRSPRRPERRSPREGGRPRSRTARPRWPDRSAGRAHPTPAPGAPRHRRHRPRRAPVDVDHLGALDAHRVGERSEADVDGAHVLQHAGARVMSELAHLAAAVRAAPGLRAKRELALLEGRGFASDGDDAALVAHGDGQLVLCGEAIAPALLAADPFAAGAAAVATNVADVRAKAAGPSRSSTPSSAPTATTRRRCSTAWRGRPSGSPCRSSAATSRSAPRPRCRPSAPAA